MPTRGYRKGVCDRKVPAPRSIRTHVSQQIFARHAAEADTRNLSFSRLLLEILKAHQNGTRLEAPQAKAFKASDVRELCRIGNNVNQIAYQANLMNLHLVATRAEACLASLDDLLRRLRA